MKKLIWIENSYKETCALPKDSRTVLGHELWLVQQQMEPDDFKPMPSVGAGVYEIRVRDRLNKNKVRCFYIAKFDEGVYVLHVFTKEQQKTPPKNLEIGKNRYSALMKKRKEEKL